MSIFTKNILSLFLAMGMWLNFAYAQTSTYEEVYNIMQAKCASCHNSANPAGNLNLSGSLSDVYGALVDATPTNPAAAAKGWKLANPGYVKRSYLLNKIATMEWDDDFTLETTEGTSMPPAPLEALTKKEIELFRQWILFGAPDDGQVVEPQVLEDYYENGMALPTTSPVAAPDPSEGYQLKLGPFFLKPQEEREFFKKHDVGIDVATEVNRLEISFNAESHHFILYKMGNNLAGSIREGMRDIEEAEFAMINNTLVAAWQNDDDYVLPEGTAYRFQDDTYFDLNYHVKNYSSVGILAAEVYVNVYTQDYGTAGQEMFSTLLPYDLFDLFTGGGLGDNLIIPNTGDPVVFDDHIWIPPSPFVPYPSGTWHMWQVSTHAHSRAVDYDIYLANSDGSKGEQIYEGFSNYDHTFNQGYYDYEHPPVLTFDPLLPINMGIGGGIVHEATYINDTDETLGWGNTTDDEMMLLFVHFTEQAIVTDTEHVVEKIAPQLSVFPNPVYTQTTINYNLTKNADVLIELFDIQGKRISKIIRTTQASGSYSHSLDVKKAGLSKGIYLIQLMVDGEVIGTEKLMVN